MKFPRVRFTMRRMMVAVAVAAVGSLICRLWARFIDDQIKFGSWGRFLR